MRGWWLWRGFFFLVRGDRGVGRRGLFGGSKFELIIGGLF